MNGNSNFGLEADAEEPKHPAIFPQMPLRGLQIQSWRYGDALGCRKRVWKARHGHDKGKCLCPPPNRRVSEFVEHHPYLIALISPTISLRNCIILRSPTRVFNSASSQSFADSRYCLDVGDSGSFLAYFKA